METMHSKFVRLQTALLMLALLFTVLVPVPAYAAGEGGAEGTANSVAISDPDTFNAWELRRAITTLPQVVFGPTKRWRKTKSPSAVT